MASVHEGDLAPAFELATDRGDRVKLDELRGKWVVLYWYPKDDTPGCAAEACDIRDNWRMLEGEAELFGASADTVESHQKFRDKYTLPFPLLSDADHQVAERYGVWGPKTFAGREYMGIDRTTFIIGPDGKVAKVFEKVKPQGHALQILQSLQELKGNGTKGTG